MFKSIDVSVIDGGREEADVAIVSMTDCAEMLKALSDPTRLKVVRTLIERDCHVGDLNVEVGEIDPSLLSHHLRVLREMGIVEAQRDGKAVRYRMAPEFRMRTGRQGIDFGCCRLVFENRFTTEAQRKKMTG